MSIETSVAIIAVAFVVLVIVLISALVKAKETLAETDQLIRKLDELTADVKAKSESLNCLFRPLKSANKERCRREGNETVEEVIELVTVSLQLFEKIRAAVKHAK